MFPSAGKGEEGTEGRERLRGLGVVGSLDNERGDRSGGREMLGLWISLMGFFAERKRRPSWSKWRATTRRIDDERELELKEDVGRLDEWSNIHFISSFPK